MNPLKLLQFKNMWNGFRNRHNKFVQFMNAIYRRGLNEGTVVEIQIRTPQGQEYVSNFKVLPEDVEILKQFHESLQ